MNNLVSSSLTVHFFSLHTLNRRNHKSRSPLQLSFFVQTQDFRLTQSSEKRKKND